LHTHSRGVFARKALLFLLLLLLVAACSFSEIFFAETAAAVRIPQNHKVACAATMDKKAQSQAFLQTFLRLKKKQHEEKAAATTGLRDARSAELNTFAYHVHVGALLQQQQQQQQQQERQERQERRLRVVDEDETASHFVFHIEPPRYQLVLGFMCACAAYRRDVCVACGGAKTSAGDCVLRRTSGCDTFKKLACPCWLQRYQQGIVVNCLADSSPLPKESSAAPSVQVQVKELMAHLSELVTYDVLRLRITNPLAGFTQDAMFFCFELFPLQLFASLLNSCDRFGYLAKLFAGQTKAGWLVHVSGGGAYQAWCKQVLTALRRTAQRMDEYGEEALECTCPPYQELLDKVAASYANIHAQFNAVAKSNVWLQGGGDLLRAHILKADLYVEWKGGAGVVNSQ
jgi:hypothetical protein